MTFVQKIRTHNVDEIDTLIPINNSVVKSKLRYRTVNKFKTNLVFLKQNLFYRIASRSLKLFMVTFQSN